MPSKIIRALTNATPLTLMAYSTLIVLASSIPLVYLASLLAGVQYTRFLFAISVVLPLILTPVVTKLLIHLANNLAFVQEKLRQEIESNRQKDLIMFEQARFVLMGEMLANISHQWKQPLNTINLALLNMKLQESGLESRNKNFTIIEENVNYLASTIDDFMSFFDKRTHSEIKPLEEVIREIHSVIDAHLENKNIKLEIVTDELSPKVELASSITQVLLNLISNAKDALKAVEDKKIYIHFVITNSGVEIACCDNGKGIESNIVDKIFEPYFTTKDKTQGTGIGLYMSREIVYKVFNGNMDVNRQDKMKNYTTCFYITLPYSKQCVLKGENDDT
ncbi:histidine kinase [hydrothermal vent metagenome]|uniref:Histidine kinase n=1 Tax=hydrothermal vent metagenome TaxID=652676 RepID=A0A1W1CC62_9ZZZZ